MYLLGFDGNIKYTLKLCDNNTFHFVCVNRETTNIEYEHKGMYKYKKRGIFKKKKSIEFTLKQNHSEDFVVVMSVDYVREKEYTKIFDDYTIKLFKETWNFSSLSFGVKLIGDIAMYIPCDQEEISSWKKHKFEEDLSYLELINQKSQKDHKECIWRIKSINDVKPIFNSIMAVVQTEFNELRDAEKQINIILGTSYKLTGNDRTDLVFVRQVLDSNRIQDDESKVMIVQESYDKLINSNKGFWITYKLLKEHEKKIKN